MWLRGRLGPTDAPRLAPDGKTARGSRDGQMRGPPGQRLRPAVKAVLGQLRVGAKSNEHKAALELLEVLPLAGKVVTGDAMLTHRDVCEVVIAGGGDYILPVRDNQLAFARDTGTCPLRRAETANSVRSDRPLIDGRREEGCAEGPSAQPESRRMPPRKPSRHDRFRPQGREIREIGAPNRLRVLQERRVAELLGSRTR